MEWIISKIKMASWQIPRLESIIIKIYKKLKDYIINRILRKLINTWVNSGDTQGFKS